MTGVDPILAKIQDLTKDFDLLRGAQPNYSEMRRDMARMRAESTAFPSNAAVPSDKMVDMIGRAVAYRATMTGYAVSMTNYVTLWRALEQKLDEEFERIQRSAATTAEARSMPEAVRKTFARRAVPDRLTTLIRMAENQRKFADSMKEVVKLELEQMDWAYQGASRIVTIVEGERKTSGF